MDITITLKDDKNKTPLHGPETSNNLPAGVAMSFAVRLREAIKEAVVSAVKSKDIKNVLAGADWSFDSGITDAMTLEDQGGFVGQHKLKFKVDGKVLGKTVRCNIAGVEAKAKAEKQAKVNNAALSAALKMLETVSTRFGEPRVVVKAGDKKHPTSRQYVLQVDKEKWSGSIPAPDDVHSKGRATAVKEWEKNLKEFLVAVKNAG
jgi:hypothetical protein